MMFRLSGVLVWLAVLLIPVESAEVRPRSILVLDQSDLRGAFYHEIFAAFLAEVSANPRLHTTVYAEDLDLGRFSGADYEEKLREYLGTKYRDKPVGVIVAVGAATLELVLRWRAEMWPDAPVVFAVVDEQDLRRLDPPPDVTGNVFALRFSDCVKVAQAVVPNLKSIFIVGDSWDRQMVFRAWKAEVATAAGDLDVKEIVGLTMDETRQRVSQLPAGSAILYSSMHSDGEGAYYSSAVALSLIAEKANRPIIVAGETLLASGGIGGYALLPGTIGAEAARLALRILGGETASDIPRKFTEAVRPIFNWKQMQRWGVTEADLPEGSEIRFRDESLWKVYRWQIAAIIAFILIQAGLIAILLHERARRSAAEAESRSRLTELAHVGRQAIAGELSQSVAHELNQPLGAILTNAETGELILESPSPDLEELKDILADIRRDDLRASEVIHRMRSLLRRTPFEIRDLDLNDIVRDAFEFLKTEAATRDVALLYKACSEALPIKGDAIQLQQVILNLIVNSMEAMSDMPCGRAVIGHVDLNGGASAVVAVSDAGPGIPPDKLAKVFDPFFTTTQEGMGLGLSIARTIVQAHQGDIWAENHPEGGAVFYFSIPLATR